MPLKPVSCPVLRKSLTELSSPRPEMVMVATPSHPLVRALRKANVDNNAEEATTCQPVLFEKVQGSVVSCSSLISTCCLTPPPSPLHAIQSTEHLFPHCVLQHKHSPENRQLYGKLRVTVAPQGPHKSLQRGPYLHLPSILQQSLQFFLGVWL